MESGDVYLHPYVNAKRGLLQQLKFKSGLIFKKRFNGLNKKMNLRK